MAASIHLLASMDNPGHFESDAARENLLRDELTNNVFAIDASGCVHPQETPGLGIEVNEAFLRSHPVVEGPAYV
jgi:D-galactarolactone cycloisomerase